MELVVISGGMDSTTLLYHVVREKASVREVKAVSFNYGQRHKKELDFAATSCRKLGVQHRIVDMGFMATLLAGSALTSDTVAVPDGHYAEESMRATVVPNRNMIMLSVACGIAVAEKAEHVWAGMHAGDHFIYPDCRPEFIDALDFAVKLANKGFISDHFSIQAPFIYISKAEIADWGHRLDVPWEDTWSCYKGNQLHCGTCGTCTERREAFENAGIDDPTQYSDMTRHY
jgi:7-cyano-7-deazaguanine synthase